MKDILRVSFRKKGKNYLKVSDDFDLKFNIANGLEYCMNSNHEYFSLSRLLLERKSQLSREFL